ncbi:MAG: glycosyltransferase [Sphingobacteriales bacterium]
MKENFLSIVWYKILPAHYGGQQGIANFNKYLGEKIDLTCLCSTDNKTNENLTYKLLPLLPVSKSQFINPLTRRKILSLIKTNDLSPIILAHPYHAWLGKYKQQFNFKLIVHAHNIEFMRMKGRKKWWWPWVKLTEDSAFKNADYILFKTEKDKELAKRTFAVQENNCVLVPYGVNNTGYYENHQAANEKIKTNHGLAATEKIFLFAGTLDYEPNEQAVNAIITKVLPILEQKAGFPFKIFICGKQSKGSINRLNKNKNIIATGFVDSIEEYFQAADVFINPVLSGSGVQTKNFDAIADGLSVAATSFSAEALPEYLYSKKVLIAENNNWEQLADNIIHLAQNPSPTPAQFYIDFYWGNIVDKTLSKVL